MTSLTNILAATDLSEQSLNAVDRGFLIASQQRAQYTVVHALGMSAFNALRGLLGQRTTSITQTFIDQQRDALMRIVDDASRNRGITAMVRLEEEYAADTIPALAKQTHADLVLVGAHGVDFVQRLLLGSTASKLLRKSACPVLVVKKPGVTPYRRVLVALDFSPASELAIRLTRELAPEADILLLHVFEVPFEGKLRYAGVDEDVIQRYRIETRESSLKKIHELAKAAGLQPNQYTLLIQHGDPKRQIVAHEAQMDCDLIVMGKHGTHVTEELLIGSVTKRVLAECSADVLVVIDSQISDALTQETASVA